jgi:tRNA-dihydrouridine synthase 3
LPRIPIIGNGDIFSFSEYEEKVAREGINATAMLARGALVKPWLPTEIKERRHWDISASERLDLLKDYVKFGLEHWGSDQKGVNSTRRFLLEWLSFLHRYVPVGLLEVVPQAMNERPPLNMVSVKSMVFFFERSCILKLEFLTLAIFCYIQCGRNDLETLMLSSNCADWVKITEMLLGPVPEDFKFDPKHKANGYK